MEARDRCPSGEATICGHTARTGFLSAYSSISDDPWIGANPLQWTILKSWLLLKLNTSSLKHSVEGKQFCKSPKPFVFPAYNHHFHQVAPVYSSGHKSSSDCKPWVKSARWGYSPQSPGLSLALTCLLCSTSPHLAAGTLSASASPPSSEEGFHCCRRSQTLSRIGTVEVCDNAVHTKETVTLKTSQSQAAIGQGQAQDPSSFTSRGRS